MSPVLRILAAAAVAGCCLTSSHVISAQAPAGKPAAKGTATAKAWVPPRTADGQPDLEGVWDYRTATPLERPAAFKDKPFLTDAEVADYERRTAARADGRQLEDPRTDPSVQAPEWLDYGKKMAGSNRSSLVVDPADGRIPALTPDGLKRDAERRAASRTRGPADDPENRTSWERCITRGLPEGVLPAGYNNNIQIVQAPGYVVLLMEMIHDARIVPLDGRARLPGGLTRWMGDSRGHWEGSTLVIETTNFSSKANFRGAGERLHLVERLTRTGEDTIDYRFTVDDATTWVTPWTVALPLVRSEGELYEYACHEGNRGLENILSQARSSERAERAGLLKK